MIEVTIETIIINIIYIIILGIITNIMVEIIKGNENQRGGILILLIAWVIGIILCLTLGFDLFYRIGLMEYRYNIVDFLLTGFLCGNMSRFTHKFFEYLKQIKEVK